MRLVIDQINNKWTVNGKLFNELDLNEKKMLIDFIKSHDFGKKK